jgi:AraC-like DNA-binding protein
MAGELVRVHHETSRSTRACGPAAVHEYAALALHVGGSATVEQRGRLSLAGGDVHIVPAGERHRWLEAQDAEFWGIGLCVPCLAQHEIGPLLAPFERVRGGAAAVVTIPADRQEHLVGLFQELSRQTAAPAGPTADIVLRSLLALILAEVTRAAGWESAEAPRAPLVAQALSFIERHCLEPISLADVAAAVGRSPAHVTTAIKRATGKTAGEWITAGRLAEASRLLRSSDARIEDIAERIGYADATHFIRVFRRAHGATPAAFRAQHARG